MIQNTQRRQIKNWGNTRQVSVPVLRPENIAHIQLPAEGTILCRGQGRSYGDTALNSTGVTLSTERLNRFIAFDSDRGELTAEAGVTLQDLLKTFVPKGWFPKVTPGTQAVSLGGCVAGNVHGKNHFRYGSFGDHVSQLTLLTSDGELLACSPEQRSELFWATVGGLGLTGIIVDVTLQLRSIETAYCQLQQTSAQDLETVLHSLAQASEKYEYNVAWINGFAKNIGRGIIMSADHLPSANFYSSTHSTAHEVSGSDLYAHHYLASRGRSFVAKKTLLSTPLHIKPQQQFPILFPLISDVFVKRFNQLYYALKNRQQQTQIIPYHQFFYPLDKITNWNRLYGRKGFIHYQCVIPDQTTLPAFQLILQHLTQQDHRPYLTVIKRFGNKHSRYLSFPLPGYTLAMDLPNSQHLGGILNEIDAIVLQHQGRINLVKDSRLPAKQLALMYPELAEWNKIKNHHDPARRFHSDLSERLGLGS